MLGAYSCTGEVQYDRKRNLGAGKTTGGSETDTAQSRQRCNIIQPPAQEQPSLITPTTS